MTAWDKSGTNAATFQATRYLYGVAKTNGSAIDSNDLLAQTQYPATTTNAAATLGSPGHHRCLRRHRQVQCPWAT